MSIENFFRKIQNILSLVVVNDPQMLKSRNNIFFSYTRHLTDITIERKRKKWELIQILCDVWYSQTSIISTCGDWTE